MATRSFERALADPSASVTTADTSMDRGMPLPAPPLTAGERMRWLWRRAMRLLGTGPLGRLRRWQAALVILALFVTSGALAVYYGPATLTATPPLQTAFLTDRDGHLLGVIHPEENRVVVPLTQIPKSVQQAFVSVEDAHFWSNAGIDPGAIVRAFFSNLHGGHQGASTITQQLVKNETNGGKRTLWRKIGEAVTAIRLDRRYSKQKILAAYLNSIYLGSGAYGVEAASLTYFGHHVSKDTLAESALLAGITAAPEYFSPRTNPDGARARRDHALDRMFDNGHITALQRDKAKAEPVAVVPQRQQRVRSPLFVDWVRGEILRRFGEDVLYRGGIHVRTSLDLDVQQIAQNAMAGVLNRPGDPDAAVVAMDASTGEVRAMIGARDPKPGDFNYATQAHRQAGSAFKPFVLAAALDKGYSLTKRYRAPGSIRVHFDNGSVWPVSNYDHRGYGWLSLASATAYSVNTVYAQLIRDVGPKTVVQMAENAGITSRLSAVPSLALGTSGVTPLEMASAYGTFANHGNYVGPTGIVSVQNSSRDTVYTDENRHGSRAISRDVADGVIEALQGVVRRGTGYTARISGASDLAGKTGTTEDHRDAWFVGFARGYVVAVWVGYPSGKPMQHVHGIKVTGNSFPAQIFKRVLGGLINKYTADSTFQPPSSRQRPGAPAPGPTQSTEPSPTSAPPEPSPTSTPKHCPLLICR